MASSAPRLRDAFAIAVIGGLAILPNLLGPLSLYDGGLSGSAATFFLHGELPYRDFWWLYGPASGALVAVPTALFGPSILLLRLLGLLVVMVQVGMGYALLRTRVPHLPAAIIAIASVSPTVFATHLDVSAWSLSLALGLAAIYLRTETSQRPIWPGVLLGVAFLARLDVGAYGLVAVLLLPARRELLTGFLAVAVPFAAFEALTTPLPDLYEQLIWFPLIGTREFRSLPAPDLSDRLVLLITFPIVVVPKAAIVAAAARLALLRDRSPVFVVLTVFAALCQLQALGRSDLYHQGQAATAGFLLLGIWISGKGRGAASELGSRSARGLRASLALVVVSLVCSFALMTGTLSIWRIQRGPLGSHSAQFIAGVRTLVANSTRDEPVFVGLTSHRFTYSNDMLAYYLANRRAGVRVAMFNPGITNTDRVQLEMVDDLQRSGTQLLLLDDALASYSEASNASRIPGSTVLDEFIADRYVQACALGDVRIFVLRDRATPVVCSEPTAESLSDLLIGIGPAG